MLLPGRLWRLAAPSTPMAVRCCPRRTISASASSAPTAGRLDLAATADLLRGGNGAALPRVVVLAGAGISVSAGIPDFRTPGTGLYDNLQQYGLPYAEAIFDVGFYGTNPQPFRALCKELWPGNYAPTPTHAFLKVLHGKGLLQRCFTQNIDSLESAAGVPQDAIVAAHGNFDGAHVVGTYAPVPVDEVRGAALSGSDAAWDALTDKYGGLVKPSIVFYGERLPHRFHACAQADLPRADLLLVLGTSLMVHPFASLVGEVSPGTPRLLINRERVGDGFASSRRPFDFDSKDTNDGWYGGDCDEACWQLAANLGWTDDVEAVLAHTDRGTFV